MTKNADHLGYSPGNSGAATTGSTGTMRPCTPEEMKSALQMLAEIHGEPPAEAWLLLAPDGRAWKAKPEDLLQVLVPFHPLMKWMRP